MWLCREVADQIAANQLSWETSWFPTKRAYGGVHPGPAGNALAAGQISELLSAGWRRDGGRPTAHAMPEQPLDRRSYDAGRFLSPGSAALSGSVCNCTSRGKCVPVPPTPPTSLSVSVERRPTLHVHTQLTPHNNGGSAAAGRGVSRTGPAPPGPCGLTSRAGRCCAAAPPTARPRSGPASHTFGADTCPAARDRTQSETRCF